MSLLALAAPTTNICDPQFAAGIALPATETALTGTTGFTVPWVTGLVIRIVEGATTPGLITLVNPAPSGTPAPTQTLTATASSVLYGPIGQEFSNPTTGLVQVNVATVTTASAGAYILPQATGAKHNPFENNPANADF